MSLLDLLGAGKTVDQAHAAIEDVMVKIDPLMRDIENRMGGIAESLLDRVDGAEIRIPEIVITLKLRPIPKATAVG